MSHRIENRENVFINREKYTGFRVFEQHGNRYVYAGNYFARGHDRTEKQCLEHYFSETEDYEDNS